MICKRRVSKDGVKRGLSVRPFVRSSAIQIFFLVIKLHGTGCAR